MKKPVSEISRIQFAGFDWSEDAAQAANMGVVHERPHILNIEAQQVKAGTSRKE